MLIEQAELAASLVRSVIENDDTRIQDVMFGRVIENALKVLDIYLNDALQDHARDALKKTKIGY